MSKVKAFFAAVLLLAFATTAPAQSHWVEQFLNRYKPLNVVTPAGAIPSAADEPWRPMVQQNTLPLSVSEIIRLMLASNLDVAVSRYNPLVQGYIVNVNLLPFQPTLNIGARGTRSTMPSLVRTDGASAVSQLVHQYSISYGQLLQTGTQLNVGLSMNRSSSNSANVTLSPSYSGLVTYSVAQPLLQNFGRDINGHLIRIAKNNQKLSDVGFEMQTIDLVTAAEQMYWDLVF